MNQKKLTKPKPIGSFYDYPPVKPVPPEKDTQVRTSIKTVHHDYGDMIDIPAGVDSISIDDIDGGDDYNSSTVTLGFYSTKQKPNETYEKELEEYNKKCRSYQRKLREYNKSKSEYNKLNKAYKEALAKYNDQQEFEIYNKLKEKYEAK